MDVKTADFEREVIEASKAMPVVVDFWAPWCGPCRALGPVLERVAASFAGRIKLVKVDSDENAGLAAQFGVRSIPYVVAFKQGRPAAQFVGAQPEGAVRSFMERLLPSPSEEALARAAEEGPGEGDLRARLEAAPDDHAARLSLAARYASARRYREAMEELLEIVRRAKDWRDGEARKQLVALFSLAADEPETVAEYRRKLAAALY
jgi:putative thioredoxin